MKKFIVSLLVILLLNTNFAYAQPNFMYISSSRVLNLNFDSTGIVGMPLDWWLVLVVAGQIYYLSTQMLFVNAPSLNEVKPAAQIDALTFKDLEIKIPAEFLKDADAYYGVDFNQNGTLDLDSAVYVNTKIRF